MTIEPPEPAPEKRRSWMKMLAFPIILFLLGAIAIAWLLTQTKTGRDFVTQPGLTPQATAPAAPEPGAITIVPQTPPAALMPAPAPTDMPGRIASLEARIAELEARGPGSSGSARADAMFSLFAARRSIEHGLPLGGIETEMTSRFGTAHPRAVSAVLAAARQPTSLPLLTQQLRELAPNLNGGPAAEDWWGQFTNSLSNLIVVRDTSKPGSNPTQNIADAQKLLSAGQVEAAISQISVLPERARATDWMAAARRYAEALKALDELDEAVLAPAMPVAASVEPPIAGLEQSVRVLAQ